MSPAKHAFAQTRSGALARPELHEASDRAPKKKSTAVYRDPLVDLRIPFALMDPFWMNPPVVGVSGDDLSSILRCAPRSMRTVPTEREMEADGR